MSIDILSRRELFGIAAGAITTLTTPSIVRAQNLSHNDIWTKKRGTKRRSAVTLCFDHSGSMSHEELMIQKHGTMRAVQHPNFLHAVSQYDSQGNQGVAVCGIVFGQESKVLSHNGVYSSLSGQDGVYGIYEQNWAILENANDVQQFAEFIDFQVPTHITDVGTNIVAALDVSQKMHTILSVNVTKRACDISGDGDHNYLNLSGNYNADAEVCKTMLVDKVDELAKDSKITVNGFAMTDTPEKAPILLINGEKRKVPLNEYFERFLQTPEIRDMPEVTPGITISVSKGRGFKDAYAVGMTRKLMYEFF